MLGNDLKINPIQLRRAYLLGWLNIAFGFLLAILTIQNNLVPDLAELIVQIAQRSWSEVLLNIFSANKLILLGFVVYAALLVVQLRLNAQLLSNGAWTKSWLSLIPGVEKFSKGWNAFRGRSERND
jgi:hypothetical protein